MPEYLEQKCQHRVGLTSSQDLFEIEMLTIKFKSTTYTVFDRPKSKKVECAYKC